MSEGKKPVNPGITPIESLASLVASDEACYRWPGEDELSKAKRAAYIEGAGDYARFGMSVLMSAPHLDSDEFERRVVEVFERRIGAVYHEAIIEVVRKGLAEGYFDATIRDWMTRESHRGGAF